MINNKIHIQNGVPAIIKEKYSLITGGAGFIGINLAKRLLNSGKKVMIFDNLSRKGVENNLKWLRENFDGNLKIRISDIRDEQAIKESIKYADEVFNFAAQVAVTTSLENPIHDSEVNLRGTLNLLENIRKSGRRIPLIFTSTNKVYGNLGNLKFISNGTRYYPADRRMKHLGVNETQSLDFHSPYGCSKGAADQYVIDYSRSFDLATAVFRMSCIYGPHQCGTEDQGWVAHFVISMLENKPITIYGDGKQVRDILYIDDLINAFLLAMKNIDNLSGNVFNIGGGPKNTVSLLEIIKIIGELSLSTTKIRFKDWRTGDQRYYVSDIRKFNDETGWSPAFSVTDGVKMLFNWLCLSRGIPVAEVSANENKITA